jgi:hypothetical protein
MSRARLMQIQTIQQNIKALAGEAICAEVMDGSEQFTALTRPNEVAAWVQVAMARLDRLVDQETRIRIMSRCGYNCALINNTVIKKAKSRRRKSATLDAFLEAEQQHPPEGTRLTREGDMLNLFYTPRLFTESRRCYCALLRGLPDDQTVSLTYCQCSRGFVQKMWEAILDRPVQVDLVESCAAGAPECKFAIHL